MYLFFQMATKEMTEIFLWNDREAFILHINNKARRNHVDRDRMQWQQTSSDTINNNTTEVRKQLESADIYRTVRYSDTPSQATASKTSTYKPYSRTILQRLRMSQSIT